MSVSSHLESTASALILSAAETTSVATSITTLRSRLASYFGTEMKEQLQFGSSTRGTILPRSADERSDIDYMIVFDNTDNYQPSTFIARLRRFAENKYGSSEIYQSHPTVVLSLNHIKFDLVPAYRSYWTGLNIPAAADSFTKWLATDPNGFNSELEEKNKSSNYVIKPVIRLLKYWNALNGYVFDSYGFEQWVARNYFVKPKYVKPYFFEAVGDLQVSSAMAQWKRDKIRRAKDIVAETMDYEARDMPATAEKEIKRLIPAVA